MKLFIYSDISAALRGETDRKTIAGLQHVEAHRLLADAYRALYRKTLPALKRRGEGKPYLAGRDAPHISLSHEGGIVGVVFSGEEVGLDINRTTRAANERACRRFLSGMKESFPARPEDTTVYYATYREGETYVPTPLSSVFGSDTARPFLQRADSKEDAAGRFCRAEACLKLSGGGFADLPSLGEISSRARVLSFHLPSPHETYLVAIAEFVKEEKGSAPDGTV